MTGDLGSGPENITYGEFRQSSAGLRSGGMLCTLILAVMLSLGGCSVPGTTTATLDPYYEDIPIPSSLYRGGLTEEDALVNEQRLVANPYDILARTRLLAYYSRAKWTDQTAKRAYAQHLVWTIRHAPRAQVLGVGGWSDISPHSDPEGYADAKAAWENHLEQHPQDTLIIERLARFLTVYDTDRAIELLHKAQEIDPENYWFPTVLGNNYLLLAARPNWETVYPNAAENALAQFDRAVELEQSGRRSSMVLGGRAKSAFLAKKYDLAAEHATAMLDEFDAPGGSADGDLVHRGHTILGLVATLNGNVEQAKVHLLESAKGPSSPVLGSFGPSMALAFELLQRGEFDVVVEYFELCSVFWNREKLERWKVLVEKGIVPDFGGQERK